MEINSNESDLNVKFKTIKLLEDNVGKVTLGLAKSFDTRTKAQPMKEEIK